MLKSIEGNFDNQEVHELLIKHFIELRAASPEGSAHVLDIPGLKVSSIKFWSLWQDENLIGCGALKFLDEGHGEFKSIRVNDKFREKGYGKKIISILISKSKDIGLKNELVQVCNPSRPGTFLHGRRGHLRFEFRVMPEDDEVTIKSDTFVWELLAPWINKDNASLERAAIYTFHACIAETWNIDNIFIIVCLEFYSI